MEEKAVEARHKPNEGPTMNTHTSKTQSINDMRADLLPALRGVGIGLAVLAGCAGLIAVLFFLDRVTPPIWYGWARIITRDYSSVTPALWINWGSMIAAAWALGISYKLGNARFQASQIFAAVMVIILIFVTIPAVCALWAVTSDLPFPLNASVSLLDKVALMTAFITSAILILGPIGLFFYGVMVVCAVDRD